jgi:hypothetical protein
MGVLARLVGRAQVCCKACGLACGLACAVVLLVLFHGLACAVSPVLLPVLYHGCCGASCMMVPVVPVVSWLLWERTS